MAETTNKPKTKAELMAEKMAKQRVGQTAFEAGKKPIVENTVLSKEESIVNETETKDEKNAAAGAEVAQDAPKSESKVETPLEQEKPAQATQEPPAADEASAVMFSLDDIAAAKRPEKKTYSVYLSTNVMAELEKRAKKAKLKPSAYLDELLKRVLGL